MSDSPEDDRWEPGEGEYVHRDCALVHGPRWRRERDEARAERDALRAQLADLTSGLHVGPGEDDFGPSGGEPVPATDIVAERDAARADVDRLREQNKAAAEKRDRDHAELQSRVARYERWVSDARNRMEHARVDWTNDPPSQKPGGWWSYSSSDNCGEVVALASELDRSRADVDTLLEAIAAANDRTDPPRQRPGDGLRFMKARDRLYATANEIAAKRGQDAS